MQRVEEVVAGHRLRGRRGCDAVDQELDPGHVAAAVEAGTGEKERRRLRGGKRPGKSGLEIEAEVGHETRESVGDRTRRHANRDGPRIEVIDDDRIGPDLGSGADPHRADDLGAGTDVDALRARGPDSCPT